MNTPIRGKVARVLNAREIAINIGSTQGVIVGMYFDIIDPKGEDIKDPDTQQILGSLGRPKVRVQVTYVQEKLSVATTYQEKKANVSGRSSMDFDIFAHALMPSTWITKKGDIKVGDPVVQVIEESVEQEIANS